MKKVQFLNRAIKAMKQRLEKRAKEKGLTENFGQGSVMRLERDYIDNGDYSEEMNKARNMIAEFNDWCMNYEG